MLLTSLTSLMEHTSEQLEPWCPPLGFVEPRVSSAVNQLPPPTGRRHLRKGELGVTVCDMALKEGMTKIKPRW